MTDEIEKLVLDLKSDSRFKILKDNYPGGTCIFEDDYYYERTDLESNNLKIVYLRDIFKINDEIIVADKREDVYAFCTSPILCNLYWGKPIIKSEFTSEELKDYIEKNA